MPIPNQKQLRLLKSITGQVIRHFEGIPSPLTSDFPNAWCDMIEQAERSESIYWATYERTLDLEIEFELKELSPEDLEELWRATESSLDYEFELRWFKEHSDLPQEENPPPKRPCFDEQLEAVAKWIHDEVLSTAQVSVSIEQFDGAGIDQYESAQ